MVEQPEQVPRAGPAPLPALDAYLRPYASLFRHPPSQPTWESLARYVTGLLTDLPRKNCDTIAVAVAVAVAGTTTEWLQHLLTDADWDPLALDEARVRRSSARPDGRADERRAGTRRLGAPPARKGVGWGGAAVLGDAGQRGELSDGGER